MQIKSKKLKGFTLVELIVVIAIFSMVMFGALALILPVSNQFRSTVKFENVRANLDNIRLYIEGSLRYADRVHIYTGTDGTNIDTAVGKFVTDYKFIGNYDVAESGVNKTFNRAAVDTSIANIEVYVMEIHNGDTDNKGKISLSTYDSAGAKIGDTKQFAVNKAFYDNYGFNINFGSPVDQLVGGVKDGVIDSNDYVGKTADDPVGYLEYENFSPGNFAVTVEAEEKNKDGTYKKTNFNSTATFALMNVWDGGVKRDLFYSKNITDTIDEADPKYTFKNPDGTLKAPDTAGHSELRYKTFNDGTGDNIFIVFTLPKQITTP